MAKKQETKTQQTMLRDPMSWEDVCHFLAQACINLDYAQHKTGDEKLALMTIEPNSKVHRALAAFCEYVTDGLVDYSVKGFKARKVVR